MRLVGFVFDSKLKWAGMIDRVRSKARARLGALFRMCGVLNTGNRVLMYKAFIRSAMEYGCLQYMSASPTHTAKLDQVQRTAERICGCEFNQTLHSRREAAAFGLACKLLDGKGRGKLQDFTPHLKIRCQGRTRKHASECIKVVSKTNSNSLDSFIRGFEGQVEFIFDKIPQEMLKRGQDKDWKSIMKIGQRIISTA